MSRKKVFFVLHEVYVKHNEILESQNKFYNNY